MAAKERDGDNALLNTSGREDVELAALTRLPDTGRDSKGSKLPGEDTTPAKKEEDPKLCGISLKWFSLLSLTLQTTWQVFIIKYAIAGQSHYLNSTVILFAEMTKIAISFLMEARSVGVCGAFSAFRVLFMTQPLDALKYSVPGMLYMLQNNLIFYSLEKLSMAVQQVTYQLKILTAAILSVVFLGKKVTGVQWVALIGLVIGVVVIQLPEEIVTPKQIDLSNGPPDDNENMFDLDTLFGLGAVLLACFFSGCAGVFMEMTLKEKQSGQSLWFKNVPLGIFGGCSALFGALWQDGSAILEHGFTQGYTWRVWLVVFTLATGGLMAAVVLRYADNILRQFSTAISILLTTFLSAVVLQEMVLGTAFFVGASMAIGATFMYNLGLPGFVKKFIAMQ